MDLLSVCPVVLKGLEAAERIAFWPEQERSGDMEDLRSALLAVGIGADARACTEREGRCNAVHVPKVGGVALGRCVLLYGHVDEHQWAEVSDEEPPQLRYWEQCGICRQYRCKDASHRQMERTSGDEGLVQSAMAAFAVARDFLGLPPGVRRGILRDLNLLGFDSVLRDDFREYFRLAREQGKVEVLRAAVTIQKEAL